jgi:tectonin beta-propeller repeat-containing protein 1
MALVSVGMTAVWAVDTGGNLWRREQITPTFPEGTKWSFVCNHVRKVSVGPKDQVLIFLFPTFLVFIFCMQFELCCSETQMS